MDKMYVASSMASWNSTIIANLVTHMYFGLYARLRSIKLESEVWVPTHKP